MQPQLLVPPQGEGSEQQVDIGGTKGEPPQLQVINGTAWLLPRGFPWKGQCLWVGRVVYS